VRNLLRCRRGAAALTTVVALVPVIAAVGLGAEAGSWYVTKQRAQNAADAAAYSGGLTLACSLGAVSCADTQSVDYRGKELAAQNAFCNAGDTTAYPGSQCATSPPSGTSQSVQIASLTSWNGVNGNFVQATVGQQGSTVLAKLVGVRTVNIRARATARVQNLQDVCVLGLGRWPSSSSALTLGGSVSSTGTGCALMSDNTVKYASTPTFSGSGWVVDAVQGCVNSGNCNPGVPYNYSSVPATNPLQVLDTESFNTRTGNTSPTNTCKGTGKCYSLTPNGTGAYNGLTVGNGDTATFAPGTYFFYNATIKITGGQVTGTGVTLVLLGDSSLQISGGTVKLSAPASNTFSPALNGVLIDDQAPNRSSNDVTINGGSNVVALGGAMYFPNVNVTWNGTTANSDTTCSMVIGNTVTMSGGAYMSTQGCTKNTIVQTQVVALVP
jgi:hypothetical protein